MQHDSNSVRQHLRAPARPILRAGQPTPVAAPRLIRLNRRSPSSSASIRIGSGEKGAQIFAGNRVPENAEPIATAYAGHQFGGFVPQLGDGRAILLGEVSTGTAMRRDIQLKGAGRTPFSRGGDGRAALGPVLREYVVSEAMAALGIPTTRALAAVTTGERCFARRRSRAPCSRASHPATSASARSSSSPRAGRGGAAHARRPRDRAALP